MTNMIDLIAQKNIFKTIVVVTIWIPVLSEGYCSSAVHQWLTYRFTVYIIEGKASPLSCFTTADLSARYLLFVAVKCDGGVANAQHLSSYSKITNDTFFLQYFMLAIKPMAYVHFSYVFKTSDEVYKPSETIRKNVSFWSIIWCWSRIYHDFELNSLPSGLWIYIYSSEVEWCFTKCHFWMVIVLRGDWLSSRTWLAVAMR